MKVARTVLRGGEDIRLNRSSSSYSTDDEKEMIKVVEKKNDKLKEARIEMNYLTGDAEVRRLAELREKWEMDRVSAINHASRIGKEEGRKER